MFVDKYNYNNSPVLCIKYKAKSSAYPPILRIIKLIISIYCLTIKISLFNEHVNFFHSERINYRDPKKSSCLELLFSSLTLIK